MSAAVKPPEHEPLSAEKGRAEKSVLLEDFPLTNTFSYDEVAG